MKAEAFVKLLRTIVSEEVRKVVREEMRGMLNEQNRPNLKDKYKGTMDSGFNMSSLMNTDDNYAVPTDKSGKPKVVNVSNNPLMNSILMETATQMKMDPGSRAFFEGLS